MMGVRKQKFEASRRRFSGRANVTVTAVQERSLGCAFDDDAGKGYPKKFEGRNEWLVTSY